MPRFLTAAASTTTSGAAWGCVLSTRPPGAADLLRPSAGEASPKPSPSLTFSVARRRYGKRSNPLAFAVGKASFETQLDVTTGPGPVTKAPCLGAPCIRTQNVFIGLSLGFSSE
jgi:hypothetical protein